MTTRVDDLLTTFLGFGFDPGAQVIGDQQRIDTVHLGEDLVGDEVLGDAGPQVARSDIGESVLQPPEQLSLRVAE